MGIASSSFSDRRVWSDDLSHPDLAAFAEVLTGERPHRRMIVRASRVFGLAICLLLLASAASSAQGSPAQWMARIFDPASLGITQFPGAVLNRKLSVDAIVLERGGDKRIGMFIIPLDQLKAAADHFATQFGIPAQVTARSWPTPSTSPGVTRCRRSSLGCACSSPARNSSTTRGRSRWSTPRPRSEGWDADEPGRRALP
jgi:hypothetical protein